MKRASLVVLISLAACGPGFQAGDPSAIVSPLALEPPPIYSLLGYRQDLALTSEQVVALDSIAQTAKQANQPPIDRLTALANRQSGRYRGVIVVDDETRPLLEQVRENNLAAARAVEELLGPEQEEEVCELFNRERLERDRRDPRAARERERERRLEQADTARFIPLRGWPWCEGSSGS